MQPGGVWILRQDFRGGGETFSLRSEGKSGDTSSSPWNFKAGKNKMTGWTFYPS